MTEGSGGGFEKKKLEANLWALACEANPSTIFQLDFKNSSSNHNVLVIASNCIFVVVGRVSIND